MDSALSANVARAVRYRVSESKIKIIPQGGSVATEAAEQARKERQRLEAVAKVSRRRRHRRAVRVLTQRLRSGRVGVVSDSERRASRRRGVERVERSVTNAPVLSEHEPFLEEKQPGYAQKIREKRGKLFVLGECIDNPQPEPKAREREAPRAALAELAKRRGAMDGAAGHLAHHRRPSCTCEPEDSFFRIATAADCPRGTPLFDQSNAG